MARTTFAKKRGIETPAADLLRKIGAPKTWMRKEERFGDSEED